MGVCVGKEVGGAVGIHVGICDGTEVGAADGK